MKKLKNIFGSKKEKKSKNPNPTGSIAKYNQSEVDGFLVLSSNEPIKKNKNLNDNNNLTYIDPSMPKDKNFYNEEWEKKEELYELKDEKELLELLWGNISSIINNNLKDFTCKYRFIF